MKDELWIEWAKEVREVLIIQKKRYIAQAQRYLSTEEIHKASRKCPIPRVSTLVKEFKKEVHINEHL